MGDLNTFPSVSIYICLPHIIRSFIPETGIKVVWSRLSLMSPVFFSSVRDCTLISVCLCDLTASWTSSFIFHGSCHQVLSTVGPMSHIVSKSGQPIFVVYFNSCLFAPVSLRMCSFDIFFNLCNLHLTHLKSFQLLFEFGKCPRFWATTKSVWWSLVSAVLYSC